MDVTDIYRIFYQTVTEYTFFPGAHGNFSKIHHIFLGHEASLNKYKKTGVTSNILADHNGIKLEINSKRKYRKY
jgi:hypothetical protein